MIFISPTANSHDWRFSGQSWAGSGQGWGRGGVLSRLYAGSLVSAGHRLRSTYYMICDTIKRAT